MLNIQPKIHTHIFIISNEARDVIYDFAGTYIDAVKKFEKDKHYCYRDRCVVKVQIVEDPIFGSCVPVQVKEEHFDTRP
ncbi:hypothetical protein EVB81_160 [Rhizobium phage RHph_I46]|uniref:Uncharacterized protein n=1 Tax=Rhizobium phage RHph_I1_9 TaxID=2509729 RepID=A0A7S5UYJ6_9CAUD|nr:hypothetical protein PP936_gp159 [Rhizobium phage RHph_I1_9]QIG69729.1 hypothetical protein EVB81_160 [Rhizobium phage RHph_I46]QIG71010.1 hypothetical protein EVB92_160 [Rhizobium phage RHph_I9]QIG73596.1 hypothetical protein EVC04_159 [Rhizobium phage RHph_I1_9]QIG76349.1 hypothetical protein EVC25_160 [Rhizobium phage RHph_I34]